jgi:hypothetical protein
MTAKMLEIFQNSLPPPAYGDITKQNIERFFSSQSSNYRTKNLLGQKLLDPTWVEQYLTSSKENLLSEKPQMILV